MIYSESRGGFRKSISLIDGGLQLHSEPLGTVRPLDRDRFGISTGSAGGGVPTHLWPTVVRPPPGTSITVVVPLWLLIVTSVVPTLWLVLSWLRRRRRRRRGLCLCCAYARPGTEAPCPECGTSPKDAEIRTRPPIGRLIRDAGAGVFLVLLVLSGSAWLVVRADQHSLDVHRAAAFDYSWYLQACQPKLNGAVQYALPGPGPESLANIVRTAGPGTTIVLLPGRHDLGDLRYGPSAGGMGQLDDVWLLGCGADSTTLSLRIQSATGARIEGVTIDCGNNDFADFRESCTLSLRACRVQNYNSGAGGSNAIFAAGSVLLI